MLLGSKLLNDAQYAQEYERVLNLLSQCQYPDGGWPYIKTTNENIHYHEMVLASVARAYILTKSPVALEMVRKSIPFYKLSVGPSMLAEYVTDPFWKHNWAKLLSRGPDIVAGLTGDMQNKWVANRSSYSGKEVLDIYAAMCWKAMPDQPLLNNHVVLDRNVNGPRGQFANWNWVCSASYGTDTLVGCYSSEKQGSMTLLQGMLAVRAEIPNRTNKQWSLGMPPSGYKGKTLIEGDLASFSADYKMGCFRSLWGVEQYPKEWYCKQKWELGPSVINGEIHITSGDDQVSEAPRVRLLFGRNGTLREVSKGKYVYGSYQLTIDSVDFTETRITSASVSSFDSRKLDGYELILSTNDSDGHYIKGQNFILKITLNKD
jgi:hypothetical protein